MTLYAKEGQPKIKIDNWQHDSQCPADKSSRNGTVALRVVGYGM